MADYCAVAYHSGLTDEEDELLESLQSHALKYIFGPQISAGKMRAKADIPTMRQRRIELCDKFVGKALKDARFGDRWFPLNTGRSTRVSEKYLEVKARCDRLRDSPVHYFRRRLNGKEGKKYGERNKYWREC